MSTTAEKKYVWLKLKEDFFSSKRIKKLRKMAGGDTYTIIYLKMQLLSLKSDGVLSYTGLEDNFASELALDLDERPEDVQVVLMYLASCGLIETSDNVNFLLPYVVENTGKETDAAQRMREMRKRNNVTPALRECYTEKEIEGDIDKEIDKDTPPKSPSRGKREFVPPTLEEVAAYCRERDNNIDAEAFLDFYESKGWMIGKNRMKDWKAAVRTWEKSRKEGTSGGNQTGITERDRQREAVRKKYEGRNFFSD